MLSPVQDIRGFSMKTEEYKEFLQKQIKKSEDDIGQGRLHTPEQFYERAMSAIARAQKEMKRSA